MGGRPSAAVRAARLKQQATRTMTERERDNAYNNMTVEELNDLYKKQRATAEQLAALDTYQGMFYTEINADLRGGKENQFATLINQIENKLEADVTLHRGIDAYRWLSSQGENPRFDFVNSFFTAFENGTIAGTRFQDKAFVSTSAGNKAAFASDGGSDGFSEQKAIQFKIRAKKGAKVFVPRRDNGGYSDENEVLLPSGSKFTVVNARYGNNNRTLILDVDLE